MFKKFGAALATCALAATLGVVAIPGAMASSEPAVPTVTLTPASCTDKANRLSVTGFTAENPNNARYRFVIEVAGESMPLKQLNGAERTQVFAGETNAATIFGALKLKAIYGKTVTIKIYWQNTGKGGAFKFPTGREVPAFPTQAGDNMTSMVPLGTSNTITLVDPAGLNCAPAAPAPKTSADDITVPTFALTAAQCEAGKATDNVMTVDKAQKHANYRFVATYDGKSISLKEELRNKLWTEGKLTAGDIKTAYPAFVFNYTKPLMVQAYWFDAEKAYAPALYDTALKLTVGDSARFIKRGEAKTLTLVDPAGLNCAPAAPAPKTSADDITVPTFTLTAAQCEAGKATDNVMTVDKAQKHANYRFVATYDGKSISLKEELRNKLWTEGKLTAKDIQAAYPTFVFDYTKPLMVQAYWFDAEKAYAPALYDTALKLTVGDSARFIKRGEAKTLTLVDPASLKCNTTTPPATKPGTQPDATKPGTTVKPKSTVKEGKTSKIAKTGFESAPLLIAAALAAAAAGTFATRRRASK